MDEAAEGRRRRWDQRHAESAKCAAFWWRQRGNGNSALLRDIIVTRKQYLVTIYVYIYIYNDVYDTTE